jgi:penicillin amidase
MDSACISWVFADTSGNIGFTSPCRVPVRKASFGTFPVPGWLAKYEWDGYVPKAELPSSFNPVRGYIATANNQAVPFDRFPTAYNNDANPPNRFVRIDAYLKENADLTPDDMGALALDTGVSYWPKVRESLYTSLCRTFDGDMLRNQAIKELCGWDGMLTSGSVGATIFVLMTNAMVDRALADELRDGVKSPTWRYVQSIPHFEALVDWTWQRSADDPAWDDVRTEAKESREEIVKAAFGDAVALATERYGDDVAAWQWGAVRPFYLKHPFGAKGGILGSLFNSEAMQGVGGPETVFKNQFARADRESMHPAAGPAFRMVIDMADPNGAVFSLAGGASGWAKSPAYSNLTAEWMDGKMRLLTPSEGTKIRFEPGR